MPRRLGASRFGAGDAIEIVFRGLWGLRAANWAVAQGDFAPSDELRFRCVNVN